MLPIEKHTSQVQVQVQVLTPSCAPFPFAVGSLSPLSTSCCGCDALHMGSNINLTGPLPLKFAVSTNHFSSLNPKLLLPRACDVKGNRSCAASNFSRIRLTIPALLVTPHPPLLIASIIPAPLSSPSPFIQSRSRKSLQFPVPRLQNLQSP